MEKVKAWFYEDGELVKWKVAVAVVVVVAVLGTLSAGV